MKYEITKGSEKDFEGAPENTLTVYRLKGSRLTHLSPYRADEFTVGVDIIAERRPITEPVWDGEGLPPVGVECEAKYREADNAEWVSFRCVGVDCGVAFGWAGKEAVTLGKSSYEFRPIRSPEDVARDEAIDSMAEIIEYRTGCSPKPLARWLYEAGYRKME